MGRVKQTNVSSSIADNEGTIFDDDDDDDDDDEKDNNNNKKKNDNNKNHHHLQYPLIITIHHENIPI